VRAAAVVWLAAVEAGGCAADCRGNPRTAQKKANSPVSNRGCSPFSGCGRRGRDRAGPKARLLSQFA